MKTVTFKVPTIIDKIKPSFVLIVILTVVILGQNYYYNQRLEHMENNLFEVETDLLSLEGKQESNLEIILNQEKRLRKMNELFIEYLDIEIEERISNL